MTTDQKDHLLSEILDNPDDDLPRLIYADYLEDCGDPRGAFIRAQCQLAQLDFLNPKYYDWYKQSSILQREHGPGWAEQINQDLKKSKFHRGFIEEVTILASALVKTKGEILSQTPINWMRLNRVKGKGDAIANLKLISNLRGLDIGGIKVPTVDMVAILNSENLTNLTGLKTLAYNSEFGAEECRALCDSKAAQTLEHVEMVAEQSNLEELHQGTGFPALKRLKLNQPHESNDSQGALSALSNFHAPELEELSLAMRLNTSDFAGLDAKHWAQLKSLDLKDSALEEGFIANLVDAGTLNSLEKLNLDSCQVPQVDLEVLFTNSNLENCRELHIQLITDEVANELIGIFSDDTRDRILEHMPDIMRVVKRMGEHSPLRNLKRLRLAHLPTNGLAELIESGTFDGLESLGIWSSMLSEQDIAALAVSPLSKTLKSLEIVMTELEPNAIRRLEKAEFPNLMHAKFGADYDRFNLISHDAIERLLSGNTFQTIRFLDIDWVGVSLINLAANANLPELRIISQQHTRGAQKEIKAMLETDRFEHLFKLKMTGSFAAKDADRLNTKFGYKLEI